METRIYKVTEHPKQDNVTCRLIEAASSSKALRYVVNPRFTVTVPTTKEVAELMSKGAKVEKAGEEGGAK
jgi:hypothetical protein